MDLLLAQDAISEPWRVHTVIASFIRRVCYDAPKSFMVIKLNDTWYPYLDGPEADHGRLPPRVGKARQ